MNFFSSGVKGPDVMDLKATFENMQAMLSGPDYTSGIDQATTITMVGDMYKYIIGKSKSAIHMPAPVDYPDDKYRVMWPEGVMVKTRRSSVSSTGSGRHSGRKQTYALNPNVTTPRAMSRASSVTSTSQYSSRYIGIVEEEDDEPPMRKPAVRASMSRQEARLYNDEATEMPLRSRPSTGTNRVVNATMRPTPSIERFMTHNVDDNDEEDEPVQAPRPPRKVVGRKSRFADEEE